MPKAKNSRRKKTSAGESSPPTPVSRYKAAAYSILLGVGVFGGFSVWQSETCEAAFLNIVETNKGPLEQVQTLPDIGQSHLARGQSFQYPHPFPTSGPHAPVWADPGVYKEPPPAVELVHALEHGNIVIYYDQLAKDDFAKLESWAGLYRGQWSGIIVAQRPGLGNEVVLTAWTKLLHLKAFDTSAAAVFIDTYRGRGPEHPVR
ncbi:MAG: DUF3105 domain-containing protein [Rhodospirillales bacterium]|nr:DUF3105 domain-containing protein [Rhodospirillales bacterium]